MVQRADSHTGPAQGATRHRRRSDWLGGRRAAELAARIRRAPLLSAEEEQATAALARSGDFAAPQRMIERTLRLVVSIAKHFTGRGLALTDLIDLIEEGKLGLMHAITKFELERGVRSSSYASWWIRQSVQRAVQQQSRLIQLPVHVLRELACTAKRRRRWRTWRSRLA